MKQKIKKKMSWEWMKHKIKKKTSWEQMKQKIKKTTWIPMHHTSELKLILQKDSPNLTNSQHHKHSNQNIPGWA